MTGRVLRGLGHSASWATVDGVALPQTSAQRLILLHEANLLNELMHYEPEQLRDLANEVVTAQRSAKGSDVGDLLVMLSHVRFRQGRLEDALGASKRALATDKSNPGYANAVSHAAGQLGLPEEALKYADLAHELALKPGASAEPKLLVSIALNQAAARADLGRDDVEEAIDRARKHAEASPIEGNLKVADVLATAGRSVDALEHLARYVTARARTERGDASAADVVRSAAPQILQDARVGKGLAALIDDVLKAPAVAFPDGFVDVVREVETFIGRGETREANRSLYRAVVVAGTSTPALLWLSATMAGLGHENDAVEFLARAVLAYQQRPRGDRLAIDIIGSTSEEILKALLPDERVRDAVNAVAKRSTEPMPDEVAVSSLVRLSEEGWERFAGLVDA